MLAYIYDRKTIVAPLIYMCYRPHSYVKRLPQQFVIFWHINQLRSMYNNEIFLSLSDRHDVFLAGIPQKNKRSSGNANDTDLVHISKDCHFNLPSFYIWSSSVACILMELLLFSWSLSIWKLSSRQRQSFKTLFYLSDHPYCDKKFLRTIFLSPLILRIPKMYNT